jgi:hypothetical protein
MTSSAAHPRWQLWQPSLPYVCIFVSLPLYSRRNSNLVLYINVNQKFIETLHLISKRCLHSFLRAKHQSLTTKLKMAFDFKVILSPIFRTACDGSLANQMSFMFTNLVYKTSRVILRGNLGVDLINNTLMIWRNSKESKLVLSVSFNEVQWSHLTHKTQLRTLRIDVGHRGKDFTYYKHCYYMHGFFSLNRMNIVNYKSISSCSSSQSR